MAEMNQNKNDSLNKKKVSWKFCLSQLMTFVKPYRLKLGLALFMVFVANITFALNPTVEGMITTQLAEDAEAIIKAPKVLMCILIYCFRLWLYSVYCI